MLLKINCSLITTGLYLPSQDHKKTLTDPLTDHRKYGLLSVPQSTVLNPARQTEHTEKIYCCREPNTLHNHQQVPAEKTGQRGETTVLEIIAMIEKYIILSLRPIIYDLGVKKKNKKYCGQHLKA